MMAGRPKREHRAPMWLAQSSRAFGDVDAFAEVRSFERGTPLNENPCRVHMVEIKERGFLHLGRESKVKGEMT